MKCVRCKIAPAVPSTNICVPCHRALVHKKYWPELVKQQAKKGAKKMKHPDILKWRTDLMERYGLSAKEANRLILDSLLVNGQELVWAD